MKKLQKVIKVRVKISKMSDLKIIQDLKKLERIGKRFEKYYEIRELFEKRAFEVVISSSNYFFVF